MIIKQMLSCDANVHRKDGISKKNGININVTLYMCSENSPVLPIDVAYTFKRVGNIFSNFYHSLTSYNNSVYFYH